MKCTRCRAPAEVELRQHNSGFCRSCFILYFQRQVERAIAKERMFSPEEAVLVAVSGGKDSLALWDVLIALGYQTTGLHLSLGIGTYSDQSTAKTAAFAAARALHGCLLRRARISSPSGDHRANLDGVVRLEHAALRHQFVAADHHRRPGQEAEFAQHVPRPAPAGDLDVLALREDRDLHPSREDRGGGCGSKARDRPGCRRNAAGAAIGARGASTRRKTRAAHQLDSPDPTR